MGLERVLTRLLTKRIPFTFNRAGYYYFSRRIPADLVHHYSYPRIVEGLKTKSSHIAKTRVLVVAGKLDEYWSYLRMSDPELLGKKLLRDLPLPTSRIVTPIQYGPKADITLSETLSGLVPLTFRSHNSFMRPFARKPRGFYCLAMNGGGAGYKTR